MSSGDKDRVRAYFAPPSMAPQIVAHQKRYYAFVMLGALVCAAITAGHLALFGDPKNGGANPLNTLFVLIAIVTLAFRPGVTRTDRQLKNLLVSHVGRLPSEFGIILAVANTIDDPEVRRLVKVWTRYQLFGAAVGGYFLAMAVPLFIFAVMKR
ncbi:hypothetical protein [Noviherbaspirillum malthae]|jgi:hypothetical protein|uniref:hypothetical protein n=1 Tax=Noviherbaspirillum malthae TaxID=1260987 RepID=UPI00188F1430|nr:hypothetical protein [Noviherbaspirillum malthae]